MRLGPVLFIAVCVIAVAVLFMVASCAEDARGLGRAPNPDPASLSLAELQAVGAGLAEGPAGGMASSYGPGLWGNRLGCGRSRLWPTTVGVAHRTIRCGQPVRVCYRARCVATRVIDRGPFVSGRYLDLTEALVGGSGSGRPGTSESATSNWKYWIERARQRHTSSPRRPPDRHNRLRATHRNPRPALARRAHTRRAMDRPTRERHLPRLLRRMDSRMTRRLPTRLRKRIRAVIQQHPAFSVENLAGVDLARVLCRIDPCERLAFGSELPLIFSEMPTVNDHHAHRRQGV